MSSIRSLTGPNDLKIWNDKTLVEELLIKIEIEFKAEVSNLIKQDENNQYVEITVDGVYSTEVREEVIRKYKLLGWKRISCWTLSNNDTPLATNFKFYFS